MAFEDFTEGPWHRNIRPIGKYPTIFAGRNRHVVILRQPHPPLSEQEAEANADLIAAAPDLYRELQSCLDVMRILGRTDDSLEPARAALRKARGEK